MRNETATAKPQHTPGPWTVVEREVLEDGSVYPKHMIGGARGLTICHLESSFIAAEIARRGMLDSDEMYESPNDIRSKSANARLIAAAPELLAELRKAMTALDLAAVRFRTNNQEWNATDAEMAALSIQDSIAKAEGRS